MSVVAAVDCGATSVRVCRVDLAAPSLDAEVVHRVAHAPVRDRAGHLRWDWDGIVTAVTTGLQRCLDRGPLASIGIDTWAVDYGLLDERGDLIGAPYSYRDRRTDGYDSIVQRVGAGLMYRTNGLQLQPFNTVFQLAVHDTAELDRAVQVLWLPELLIYTLTGSAVIERTSAGCSGLVDVSTGDWAPSMLDLAGIDRGLLGDIEQAGRVVGQWRGIPVSLVAGHDTASAVAGMGVPSAGGSAFVATGTWMLAGVERDEPDTSSWALDRNFTNELGALGGYRFLRNVTGFWLLEQARSRWGGASVDHLMQAAAGVDLAHTRVPIADVDDPRLRAPEDMLATYTSVAGLPDDAPPAVVTRSIVESIATRTASVLGELADAQPYDDVVVFGGAARLSLLVQRLSDLTGRRIRVGSVESSALGNALVQGITIGAFASLAEGRARIMMDA